MKLDGLVLLDFANSCIHGERPPCACACPLDVDILDMIGKLRNVSPAAAYKVYAKSAVFPAIVSRICPEPCRNSCVRGEVDEPISMLKLERVFCNAAKPAGSFYIPPKKKSVLIVGGGVTGLSCAVKLAQRGYPVHVVEQSNRIGGQFWDADQTLLPRDILERELSRATDLESLTITTGEKVTSLDAYLSDAILIATGKDGDRFGADEADGALTLRDGVFFAGSLLHPNQGPILSIRQGVDMSYALEAYLKVGKMEYPDSTQPPCKFRPLTEKIEPKAPPVAESPDGWSPAEAKEEGQRCLLCSCKNCMDVCDMLTFYRKEPKKTIQDINDTLNKNQIITKVGLRQIMGCTQCGLCKPACPVDIDYKEICVESRRMLHQYRELPAAYYEYWITDMQFSNGEDAAFFFAPPKNKTPKYLFFPGCQMGASDSRYVPAAYNLLTDAYPDNVGILLHCCGAPAYWAGQEELHGEVLDAIKTHWEEMGKPQVLLPCPTCMEMFGKHLPEIGTISLWDILVDLNLPKIGKGKTVSVFDPCSSKYTPETQENVRTIIRKTGFQIQELPAHGASARCCGYGGLIYPGNPELSGIIRENNINQSDLDYITYCTNCRDSFAMAEKPSLHLLDLLLEDDESRLLRQPPHLTQRRTNRTMVKQQLLKEIWDVEFKREKQPYDGIALSISQDLQEKMNKSLIHEDNIKKTIYHGETTGSKVHKPASNTYTCHLMQGLITYWVEYKKLPDNKYELCNVYQHRMQIEGEEAV